MQTMKKIIEPTILKNKIVIRLTNQPVIIFSIF